MFAAFVRVMRVTYGYELLEASVLQVVQNYAESKRDHDIRHFPDRKARLLAHALQNALYDTIF